MNLKQIRIKNYRSIAEEIVINIGQRTTVVGPNNSGKTNIVNAIQAFFSGTEENTYDVLKDLPSGFEGKQTSINATFSIDENSDRDFLDLYHGMQEFLEADRRADGTFPLFLYYSSTGKPVYQLFPNVKIRNKTLLRFRQMHSQTVQFVLSKFICKTIPSVKDPSSLYGSLLLPYIKRNVAVVLDPHLASIQTQLDGVSSAVNSTLKGGNLANLRVAFEVNRNIESLLSQVDFHIDDGVKMSANSKGSGIQAATILSSLEWIGSEEKKIGKEIIWLLEEPESYLHPELAKSCSMIIDNLSRINQVVVTTHATAFVGRDPSHIYETGSASGCTVVKQCKTYSDATLSIRRALGLRYSDFFNLGLISVLVEGASDREIFTWALDQIKPNRGKNEFPILRQATFMDFTGVASLKDFLKHSYEFIRSEAAVFSVFDGDRAGVQATNDLSNIFSKRAISFVPNEDYAVLPDNFPVEGLFPSHFISEIYNTHRGWFSSYNIDIKGKLLAFSVNDGKKRDFQKALMKRASEETEKKGNYAWAQGFLKVFECMEVALAKKMHVLGMLQ